MKRLLLMKSLLVAAGLCVGASALAQETKVPFYQQDFQSVSSGTEVWNYSDPSNYNLKIETDNTKYQKAESNDDKDRYMYSNIYTESDPYGTYKNYTIEFDLCIYGGNYKTSNYTNTDFAVMPDGYSFPNNIGYTWRQSSASNHALFYLYCTRTAAGNSTSINGGSETLDLSGWHHYVLSVSETKVDYVITNKSTSTEVASGSYSIPAGKTYKCKGFFTRGGRGWGGIKMDNVDIYTMVDGEFVSNPTFDVAYNGANRTVTITGGTSSSASNTVTTYYTTDGSDPTSSSNVYSSALDISSNCTVKAITISSSSAASSIASQAVTVGKLTLAAPTFKKTAYSAGAYTITIAEDQSGLEYVPASTTIKYRVGTTGDFTTYSSAVAVPAGKTLYAYSEAANYTTSSTSTISALNLPAMTLAFGQNYVGVVDADLWMAVSAGPTVTHAKSTGDANYFIPSNDEGTSALTNENISFQFSKHATDASQDKKWGLKTTGMYADYTRGYANVKIDNLTIGQIVEVNASAIHEVTGLTELTALNFGTTHYYVTTATTAYLNIERQKTLYSINVYNLDNEIVGAMDYTTPYWNKWNTTPVVINAGETGYYKFVNHNNGGAAYQNWYLYAANDSKNYVVLRADNHQNEQKINDVTYTGTISSFPTSSDIVADLCDATVELTVNLTKVESTYTLTSTAHITKADGTVMSSDYVFTQTGLPVSSMNLFVSVENSWLELIQQAVKKDITSAGYATYYSNNALDFANATPALTASIVTGASGNSLVMENVDDVPAETGVILAGDKDTYTIPVIASSSTSTSSNKLQGVHSATVKDANSIYVLMASPSVAFYKNTNEFTVGANTAYIPVGSLPAPAGAARAFYSLFDSETTGIGAALVNSERVNNEVFNLNGQRVSQPTKGLYIVGGRKVVVK